jgi:hypothetical protein
MTTTMRSTDTGAPQVAPDDPHPPARYRSPSPDDPHPPATPAHGRAAPGAAAPVHMNGEVADRLLRSARWQQ